jgi:localization factor PodJL
MVEKSALTDRVWARRVVVLERRLLVSSVGLRLERLLSVRWAHLRLIVNVQVALQRDGYYAGPTDGMLGSQTREALAAFQADHGLTVTSAVDGPTLQTLGLA